MVVGLVLDLWAGLGVGVAELGVALPGTTAPPNIAAIWLGIREISPASDSGSASAAFSARVFTPPLRPCIFGTLGVVGVSVSFPGDPVEGEPACSTVAPAGSGDECAGGPPAVSSSVVPSAWASPAPVDIAAPTPIANAKAPTRPT